MWFVTLILLAVAAYFLWDALRDKKFIKSGDSLSNARQETLSTSGGASGKTPGGNYRNTHGTAGSPSTDAQDYSSNTTAQSGVAAGSESVAQHKVSAASDSVADSTSGRVKGAAAAAGATAVVAATSAVAASRDAGRSAAQAANNAIRDKIKFLDGPIGSKDDLTQIDGVGPVVESELNTIGIYHYNQIANFDENDIHQVNTVLEFPGRIERERWVEQARDLNSAVQDGAEASHSSAGTSGGNRVARAAAVASSAHGSTRAPDDNSDLTEADFTGAWNTDVLIEVQERMKVLNTRESDSPRLKITKEEYRAIKDDDESAFSRDRLLEILDRLRHLG